jgi:hypothetical protein
MDSWSYGHENSLQRALCSVVLEHQNDEVAENNFAEGSESEAIDGGPESITLWSSIGPILSWSILDG